MDDELTAAAARLRLALELFEAGEGLVRARLRREHPLAQMRTSRRGSSRACVNVRVPSTAMPRGGP